MTELRTTVFRIPIRIFSPAFGVRNLPLPSRSWVKTGTYIRALFGGYMCLFFMSGHGGGGVREHGGVRTYGVSEGACPLDRGHPTGAGAPCWRTALLAKSSVLDLLRPPGRERGCAGQHGHFPVPAEQRISAGGAAGGYPLFVLRRRGEAASPGRKGLHTRRSDASQYHHGSSRRTSSTA